MARTRILLAEDNEALLAELCSELKEEFEIVGTASNGQDAVDAVLRLAPDVIVLDISMPLLNGIEASLLIRERQPRAKVLFLTIHESDEYISAAFSAGASGYVTKRKIASDLAYGIREVSQGNLFVSPSLRRKLSGPEMR
jgi:two-component system nitrate/nitrite response regulator NarL